MKRHSSAIYWQLVQAPTGMTLTPPTDATVDVDGKHHALATLNWTPGRTERGQVNFPYPISGLSLDPCG